MIQLVVEFFNNFSLVIIMKDNFLRSECEQADIPDSCFAVDLRSDDYSGTLQT